MPNQMQGILIKEKNLFFLETESGDRYSIHSTIDQPKVAKLEPGTTIHGTIREYHPKQIANMGWKDRVGSIETGHLRIGALKE
jgi:hypothetical protein